MDTFIIVLALAVVFWVIFATRNRGNRSSDSSGGDGGFWSSDTDSDSHGHHDGGGHDGGDCGGGDDGGGH